MITMALLHSHSYHYNYTNVHVHVPVLAGQLIYLFSPLSSVSDSDSLSMSPSAPQWLKEIEKEDKKMLTGTCTGV